MATNSRGGDAARLALRISDVAEAIGVARRTVERELSAGRFPPCDLRIGRMQLWRPETIDRWLQGGGHS